LAKNSRTTKSADTHLQITVTRW